MKKSGIATILLTTQILITGCNNYDSNIKKPSNIDEYKKNNISISNINDKNNSTYFLIELIDKGKKETITVIVDKNSTMNEKLELIVNTMSHEAFNGLPINVTIYGNDIAKIVLKEPNKDSQNSRFTWKKDYLNESNVDSTINTIVKNILQEQHKGPWIKTVQLYYEDELITLD